MLNINDMVLKLVSDNKIIVSNYHCMIDMSQNKIILEKYVIEGDDLVVKRMDSFEIEITGKISKVILN